MLDVLECQPLEKLFSNDEQYINLTQDFANLFNYLASKFLSEMRINSEKGIDNILLTLLKYLDSNSHIILKNCNRKRDTALNEAVEIINTLEDSVCSVSQLCADINVSERTLEYAFKERYQISPSAYMKANRLHKVKQELIALKDDNTSISTLAEKYGFWHMGQFASDFKKQFGVMPSETFKKG